jgi:WD40 repeat protein
LTYSQGDGTARLWDTASGRQLAVLLKDRIDRVEFSAGGSRVMILSEDGTVRIFPVFPNTRALIAHALQVVPRPLSAQDRRRYFLETD